MSTRNVSNSGPAPDVKAKVNTQFSQTAESYRISQVHAQGPEFSHLLQHAAFDGHEVVVDAGCGAGHTAAHIAPHVHKVIAVDLSAAMLEQAARLCQERGVTNLEFLQADVEHLDVHIRARTDRPIAAIVTRYSAHHWPQPEEALGAFARLLEPGSKVFLMDVLSQDNFVYDTYLQAIEVLRDPSHVRDHSAAQWVSMFESAGFAARLLFDWTLPIAFDDWVARMQTPAAEAQSIRNLFDGAPAEVRQRFDLRAGSSDFTFSCGLIEAIRL